jgi:tetratricopeptide (TPR) repeat protein
MAASAMRRAGLAVAAGSFCMMAAGQQRPALPISSSQIPSSQISSFPGRVERVGGAGLAHATVRIEGAGSSETGDSGEFTFPLSGTLHVGGAATFHVTNWVILKPCELKNGRAYLHDPTEPIEIYVVAPRDPRLKSVKASESIIGCLIEEEASQITPRARSGGGPGSSLLKEEPFPATTDAGTKALRASKAVDRVGPHPGVMEARFQLPVAQTPADQASALASAQNSARKPDEDADRMREEFLARKAKELGFPVEELRTAIEAWTKSVEDPYEKGLAAFYNGRWAEAIDYISESLKRPSGDVVTYYVPLGCSEYWRGHYAAAESALRKVLMVHRDDPIVLNNLAVVLAAEARYSEAELLYNRALAIDEKASGPEDSGLATDLNNLALLYDHQGKYSEAEPLYQRALAIDEKALGPENLAVAIRLNNLALLYVHQGKYKDAEPLYQRALAIDEKALGPENPSVAIDLSNLALVYKHQGNYKDAEPLYKRALAIDEKALGPEQPRVAADLNNLAALSVEEGKYSEAEPLFQRALAIHEKILGPEHPDIAAELNNLAMLYKRQGKYSEAVPLYQRALAIDEKALGPQHPRVAIDLNNLALLYKVEGKYGEAEPLYQRALAIDERALGPEQPSLASTLNNLASLYYRIGKYSEAVPLYLRALAIDEKTLGPEHQSVAQIAANLATTLRKLGRDREAKAYETQAARIREKSQQ